MSAPTDKPFRTPGICNLCRQELVGDSWGCYCANCLPVAQIVYGSVDEAKRHYITGASREVCTRALDLETAKPQGSRTTIIRALERRLRALGREEGAAA